jgi:hypothetical protein
VQLKAVLMVSPWILCAPNVLAVIILVEAIRIAVGNNGADRFQFLLHP